MTMSSPKRPRCAAASSRAPATAGTPAEASSQPKWLAPSASTVASMLAVAACSWSQATARPVPRGLQRPLCGAVGVVGKAWLTHALCAVCGKPAEDI